MNKNLLKKNNELEYQIIYDMFYNRVYSDAYFITQDPFLAQDIVQDTFIKGFKHMESLKDKDRLGAWLSAIANRTAIDLIRKQKSWNEILTEDEYLGLTTVGTSATVEDTVEKNMLKEELMKRVQNLHEKHREILLLKYIHELKEKEIAECVGIKEGTVKSRIHRAKNALRIEVEKDQKITINKSSF